MLGKMKKFSLHVLGPPMLWSPQGRVGTLHRKDLALLVYAAVTAQTHGRDALATMLWPRNGQRQARANLRKALFKLARILGDGILHSERETVKIEVGEGLSLDLSDFLLLCGGCSAHRPVPRDSCSSCLPLLERAADLYRGDFLAGFTLPDSRQFDEWEFLQGEEARLAGARVMKHLMQGREAFGHLDEALRFGRKWLAFDPLEEEAHRALMRVYAKAGHRPAALRQYAECVRVLREELGAEPDRGTTELLRIIQENGIPGEPAASSASPEAPVGGPAGEVRLVTVLSVGVSPGVVDAWDTRLEETTGHVVPFLGAVDDILRRFEARREDGLADDVIAVFGVSESHEDDAERSVRAALAIRDAGRVEGLSVSAGVQTGIVSVEGSTVMGAPMNRAARLRFRAGPGKVLVSSATFHCTRGAIEYRTHLPGTPAVYEALAVKPRTEKSYGVKGMRAPMLGRDEELGTLVKSALGAVRGQGRLVIIVGEAGIGKSRLIRALRERLGEVSPGCAALWLEGRCTELGKSESYGPFREALAGWFDIRPADGPETRAARLVAGLGGLQESKLVSHEEVEDIAPVFGMLFGACFGSQWDDRLRAIPPDQVRQRTLSALKTFVCAVAESRPLLLVLDDLHWADRLSLDAVSLLMEVLADRQLLLVCAFRPGAENRCTTLGAAALRKCPEHIVEIRLGELADRVSRQQVASLLGVPVLPPEINALLPGRIRGNPFFTEELVRSLVDNGDVRRDGASWRVRIGGTVPSVPANVLALTQSRVDRLGEEARVVLQGASVLGPAFTANLAEQTVPPSVDVGAAIQTLCGASLVFEESSLPVPRYSFTHELVREAVYTAIPAARRAQLHGAVARAMESAAPGDIDEASSALAFHFDKAGISDKAVEYLLRAGSRAERRYLNEEAKADYERALELLGDGTRPGDLRRRMLCMEGLGVIHHTMAEYAEAERCWRKAIDAGTRLGIPAIQLAGLHFKLGLAVYSQDRVAQARTEAKRGLALLGEAPTCAMAANLMTLVARCHRFFDDDAFIASILESARIIEALPELGEIAAPEVCWVAETFIHLRMKAEAGKWHALARRIAEENQDPAMLAYCFSSVGFYALFYGDLRQALEANTRALEIATRIGDPELISYEHLYIAWCHEWRGDLDAELMHSREGLAHLSSFERETPLSDVKRADSFRNMATAFFGLHRHAEGLEHLFGAIGLYRGFLRPGYIAAHGVSDIGLSAKTLVVLGMHDEAKEILVELFARAPHRIPNDLIPIRLGMATALSALEAAVEDPERFRAFCRSYQEEHPDALQSPFRTWYLESSAIGAFTKEIIHESFVSPVAVWRWEDPFEDCGYRTGSEGLEIRASNGRDLWHLNTGAPRLMRGVTGRFAVQAVCRPSLPDIPALGGICIWQDEDHFFHVEKGSLGKEDLTFKGCVGSRAMIFGRGRLQSDVTWLRMERDEGVIRALCSPDGKEWLSLGEIRIDLPEALETGIYCSGWIDRSYYHGAFPEGAAIRFDSFQLFA
jgi:DNA-binding SARP family transcriptional activator/class 3 adenylate cyclase/tetratricopeptide (TPR) repeat protein